jgi:hypothetical protein
MIKLNILMQIDSLTTGDGINKFTLFESIWFWVFLIKALEIILVLIKYFKDKKKLALSNAESNDEKKD